MDLILLTCARKEKDLQLLQQELKNSFPDVQVFTQHADVAKKTEVQKFGNFVKACNEK
jgi:short-subunit dehydrogenase